MAFVSGESFATGLGIQSTLYVAPSAITDPGHWESAIYLEYQWRLCQATSGRVTYVDDLVYTPLCHMKMIIWRNQSLGLHLALSNKSVFDAPWLKRAFPGQTYLQEISHLLHLPSGVAGD